MTGKYREELLPHISPLGWEHINFLGEYSFKANAGRKFPIFL